MPSLGVKLGSLVDGEGRRASKRPSDIGRFLLIEECLGGVITGTYGAIHLRSEWSLGSEHAFRGSGTIMAYAIIGIVVGLFVSGFLSLRNAD